MVLAGSFLFFSLFALYLIYSLVLGNVSDLTGIHLLFLGLAGIFCLKQLQHEWKRLKNDRLEPPSLASKGFLLVILALVSGAYVTFIFNHSLGMGGVLASSAVGLAGAYFFKPYATAIYCGSFAGMACNIIFADPRSFLTATLLTGILFVLTTPLFKGYGGKLGFTAFCGTVLASLLFQSPLRTLDPLAAELYPGLVLIIIFAGMATYFLQDKFTMNPVTASALVGLTVAVLHPDPGHISVVAAFCASFTGMVSKERAKNYSEMLFLTLLTAALFIAVASLFDGAGGKLGATAFIATVSGRAMLDALVKMKYTVFKQADLN